MNRSRCFRRMPKDAAKAKFDVSFEGQAVFLRVRGEEGPMRLADRPWIVVAQIAAPNTL